jgi:hypothetical protein
LLISLFSVQLKPQNSSSGARPFFFSEAQLVFDGLLYLVDGQAHPKSKECCIPSESISKHLQLFEFDLNVLANLGNTGSVGMLITREWYKLIERGLDSSLQGQGWWLV